MIIQNLKIAIFILIKLVNVLDGVYGMILLVTKKEN